MSDHQGIFTQFFLDPEVFFSLLVIFINATSYRSNRDINVRQEL